MVCDELIQNIDIYHGLCIMFNFFGTARSTFCWANQINSNSKEQDKKLSNFLSTQLNTQSSISQLISQLTKEGLIDSSTKKNLINLDKGIQKLIILNEKNNQSNQEVVLDAKTKKFFENIHKNLQVLVSQLKK